MAKKIIKTGKGKPMESTELTGRQLRLTPELWDALDRIADQHERSANTEMLRMLRRAVEVHDGTDCPECAARKALK